MRAGTDGAGVRGDVASVCAAARRRGTPLTRAARLYIGNVMPGAELADVREDGAQLVVGRRALTIRRSLGHVLV